MAVVVKDAEDIAPIESPLALALRQSLDVNEQDSIRISNAVFDEAGRGASEAATQVVTRGLLSFTAVSMASIVGDRLFSGTLMRMGFLGAVSFVAFKVINKED